MYDYNQKLYDFAGAIRPEGDTRLTEPTRDHVVEVYVLEEGEELQTGIYGPLTEEEADSFCTVFHNLCRSEAKQSKTLVLPTLKITNLLNPWTVGDTPNSRHKDWTGENPAS